MTSTGIHSFEEENHEEEEMTRILSWGKFSLLDSLRL